MHNGHIGSFYWQKREQHSHHPILSMSINGASTIFSFASWVSYVLTGCSHPFMRYWQPLLAKTTAKCFLQHPENEHQWSVNSFRTSILRNQGITWIFACITVLLTALLGKITIYWRWNPDTKLIDIANCSTSKSSLMVAENLILIRYYWHTANTRALYESIDGPTVRPADNPLNSDGLAVYHGTVPEWAVWVYWRPGLTFWQQFVLDPDPDPKWPSGTVANTTQDSWPQIIDTPLTLIFMMGQGGYCYLFCL
jgi:hypothetical protein